MKKGDRNIKLSRNTLDLVFVLIGIFLLVYLGNYISGKLTLEEQSRYSASLNEFTGEFVVYHGEDIENNKIIWYYDLKTADGKYRRIIAPEEKLSLIQGGTIIKISGTEQSGEIYLLEGSEIEIINLPEKKFMGQDENHALGEQGTVVLLVNFLDNPGENPTSVSNANNYVFSNNQNSINSHIKEYSFDKTWLTGEVDGTYTAPFTKSYGCNHKAELVASVIPIADPDVDYSNKKRGVLN